MSWDQWNQQHKGQASGEALHLPTLHPDNMSKSGAPHQHVSGPPPRTPGATYDTTVYDDDDKATPVTLHGVMGDHSEGYVEYSHATDPKGNRVELTKDQHNQVTKELKEQMGENRKSRMHPDY